jgi:hypothetical protein
MIYALFPPKMRLCSPPRFPDWEQVVGCERMPEIGFPAPLEGGGAKLHPGVGIVLSVGLAAIGVGLALWFVTDINWQRTWTMVVLIAAGATTCIAAMGVYLDRVRESEHNEYMESLRRIDRTEKLK